VGNSAKAVLDPNNDHEAARPDRNGNVVQRETLARIEVLNGQRHSVL
jgi:hypothetical protein